MRTATNVTVTAAEYDSMLAVDGAPGESPAIMRPRGHYDAGAVFLIDFDRGAIRGGENWKQKTLQRLARSLYKIMAQTATFHFSQDDWQTLLQGYSLESSFCGANDNTPTRKVEESR